MEKKLTLENDRESIIKVINSERFDAELAKSIETFAVGLKKEGGKRLATYNAMKAAELLFMPRVKQEFLLMQDRKSECSYAQRQLIRAIGMEAVRAVLRPIIEKKENTLPKRSKRAWSTIRLWIMKNITKLFKKSK